MAGSNLIVNRPDNLQRHDFLNRRNDPYQHILEAIYRSSDGRNLKDILSDIIASEKSVVFERFIIETTGTREISITEFQYNMVKDVLFVVLQGLEVYEGLTLDFVKTSPTKITFNYDLLQGDEIFIFIAGTLSTQSYGDDIYNSLSKFTQLVDVEDSYAKHEGHIVQVNENENGLIFAPVKALTELVKISYEYNINEWEYVEEWINFYNKGIIKGIKVTPSEGYEGEMILSIREKPLGNWIYYSGRVSTILWDIMSIPFIDASEQNCVYIKLLNNGPTSIFNLEIFVVL
jgi:hypothetical protein